MNKGPTRGFFCYYDEMGHMRHMIGHLPKAILFDMDDTILAYSQDTELSWRMVCEMYAGSVDGIHPETLRKAIRQGAAQYWSDSERHRTGRLQLDVTRQEIVIDVLLQLGIDKPALGREIAMAYSVHREECIQPFPGAIDTLRALQEGGVRLALLTNGNAAMQRGKIEKHQLAPFFDCILIEGEFGIGKPDRRVYLHALDCLDVTPQETWMVGDNLEWEVVMPQSLGIFAIWHDHAGAGLPESSTARPDRIIGALPELLK